MDCSVFFNRNCFCSILHVFFTLITSVHKVDLPVYLISSLLLRLEQKGHGIPESLIKDVKNIAHEFFDLPYEEKIKIKLSPAAGYRFVYWNSMQHNFFCLIKNTY